VSSFFLFVFFIFFLLFFNHGTVYKGQASTNDIQIQKCRHPPKKKPPKSRGLSGPPMFQTSGGRTFKNPAIVNKLVQNQNRKTPAAKISVLTPNNPDFFITNAPTESFNRKNNSSLMNVS